VALDQGVNQNSASIGESKSVMVLAWHLGCDLAELRYVEVDAM
jgi:hypothetical protein